MKMINSENSDMNYYESGTVDDNIFRGPEYESFRHCICRRKGLLQWGAGLRRSLF